VTAQTTDAGTTLSFNGLPADATGTITFSSNGHVLCTATLPKTSCVATGLAAGSHSILVSYSGDAAYAASSSTFTVTVTPSLALTGLTVAIPALIGATGALIALGVMLTVAARRRRRSATD
jgi:hypothetical protein